MNTFAPVGFRSLIQKPRAQKLWDSLVSRTSLPKSKSLLEKNHKPPGKASENQTANPPFNHNTHPYYLSHSEQSMLYLKNAFQIERFLKSGFPRTAVACTRNNLCSTFIHNSQSQNSSGFSCSSTNLAHAISIFCHEYISPLMFLLIQNFVSQQSRYPN